MVLLNLPAKTAPKDVFLEHLFMLLSSKTLANNFFLQTVTHHQSLSNLVLAERLRNLFSKDLFRD